MRVGCYGRKDDVSQYHLPHLLQLLEPRDLVAANRFRIGASWPRRRRVAPPPAGHERVVSLRSGGALLVLGEFEMASLGDSERVLLSAITDAIQAYKAQ